MRLIIPNCKIHYICSIKFILESIIHIHLHLCLVAQSIFSSSLVCLYRTSDDTQSVLSKKPEFRWKKSSRLLLKQFMNFKERNFYRDFPCTKICEIYGINLQLLIFQLAKLTKKLLNLNYICESDFHTISGTGEMK